MDRQLPETRFNPAVLEGLRRNAVEGFHAFRHGGIEIGGLLFGTLGPEGIKVHDFRALECQHLFGPQFQLSGADEARLLTLKNAPESDLSLGGLNVVGWYCSHGRSELELSASDRSLQENFFDNQTNLIMVLKPSSSFRTDAQLYLHQPGQPIEAGNLMVLQPPFALKPAPEVPDELPLPVISNARSLEQVSAVRASGRSRVRTMLVAAALAFVALATGLFAWQRFAPTEEPHGLTLRAEPSGSNLLVNWTDSRTAKNPPGSRAWLEIFDGVRHSRVDVGDNHLQKGATVYTPGPGVRPGTYVQVDLHVQPGLLRPVQTLTVFGALPPTPEPAPAAARSGKSQETEAELRQALKDMSETNRRLEMTLSVLRQRRDVRMVQARASNENPAEN